MAKTKVLEASGGTNCGRGSKSGSMWSMWEKSNE